MDCEVVEFNVYHGTCSKYRDSIDFGGLDPSKVKFRKDHWLGQGVYFFENINQAIWWAKDISTKPYNYGSSAIVYNAKIEVNQKEVLNLDNNNELDNFFSFVLENLNEIEESASNEYPIFTRETLRAVYFDYYKIKKNITVIMYTFPKDCVRYATIRDFKELRIQKELSKALDIYYKETQVCVSKKECIKTCTIVYDEDEEVI